MMWLCALITLVLAIEWVWTHGASEVVAALAVMAFFGGFPVAWLSYTKLVVTRDRVHLYEPFSRGKGIPWWQASIVRTDLLGWYICDAIGNAQLKIGTMWSQAQLDELCDALGALRVKAGQRRPAASSASGPAAGQRTTR
jgi:hypothetical protein